MRDTVTSGAVIRAIHALHRHRDRWPTATEIADYLRVDVAVVVTQLRLLRDDRLFTERQRNRRRVWGPWDPMEFER